MPKERAADGVQRLLDEIAQQKETLRNLENAYIDKVVAAAAGAGTPAPAAVPAGNSPAGGAPGNVTSGYLKTRFPRFPFGTS